MKRYRVFLSSTIADLAEIRTALEKMLQSLEIFEPIKVESLPASGDTSQEVCLREVAEADVVVLILKDRYGYIPAKDNSEKLSVTHLEYREAKRLGRPILAFLYDGGYPESSLASFIQELNDFNDGVFRKTWDTSITLCEEVQRALFFWIARLARETKAQEIRKQIIHQLAGYPKFSLIPFIYLGNDTGSKILPEWRAIITKELSQESSLRILPLANWQEQLPVDKAEPAIVLSVLFSQDSHRVNLEISLVNPLRLVIPSSVKFDAALTLEGARFVVQCLIAVIFLAIDDWSAAISQLLASSQHRNASSHTRSVLLAAAAYISASNRGNRSIEVVEKILQLPKLDPSTVSAGLMAFMQAGIRLQNANAQYAIAQVEKCALLLLTKALNENPTVASHIYSLARQCLKYPRAAIAFFNALLFADPTYEERWYVHRDLGLIYYNQKRYSEAAVHYERACHLKGNDSELFRMAGDAYYYQGIWSQALVCYERAVEIETVEAYFLDAKILFCKKQLRVRPERAFAFQYLRKVSHQISRLGMKAAEAGLHWFAQPFFYLATWFCKLNFDADRTLGYYQNRLGNHAKAAAYLLNALSAVPESASARLNMVMDLIFLNGNQFDDSSRYHLKVVIFHGGSETRNYFRLRLMNTPNKDELSRYFDDLFVVVMRERSEWALRRKEVLKPEVFGGIMHVEIRD